MVKKPTVYDYDEEDEDLVVGKKAKRKMARELKAQQQQQQRQVVAEEGDDTMSKVALLCQENRWREAVSLCREALVQAQAENKEDLCMTLEMALPKLEYSLRRQQAVALIKGAKLLLQKENNLDVWK